MESADLHPHPKVQDQYAKYSSMATQTSHHGQVSTTHKWNPSLFQNVGSNKYNRNLSETNIPKSRDIPWTPVPPSIRSTTTSTMTNQDSFNQQSASEFLLANMKDEMSDCFPKLSEMLMDCHSSAEHGATGQGNLWLNNFSLANDHMSTDLQLSSSGDLYTTSSHHPPSLGSAAAATSRYDFNHIFPSAHISTSDLYSTLFSSSLDLNLKALDLLTSTYATGGSCNQSLLDSAGKLSRNVPMDHDHIRERSDSPSTSSKISAFVSGSITSTKRPAGSFSETKESRPEAKKYRSSSMSRSPCPTLKVRKEKLGDRVAALQKLVAPFGKTDTASVLTEAIGYIQFLHDQVQTLSVPFMKSSQSRLYRTVQAGSKEEQGREEQKPDLRSRGLCLVPQSYASYFINSCSGGI